MKTVTPIDQEFLQLVEKFRLSSKDMEAITGRSTSTVWWWFQPDRKGHHVQHEVVLYLKLLQKFGYLGSDGYDVPWQKYAMESPTAFAALLTARNIDSNVLARALRRNRTTVADWMSKTIPPPYMGLLLHLLVKTPTLEAAAATFHYQGMTAEVEFRVSSDSFFAHVPNSHPWVRCHAASLQELEKAFHQEVNRYLADPDTEAPYSGRLLLRLHPLRHAEATKLAEEQNISLNEFVVLAIQEKIAAANRRKQYEEELTKKGKL